MSLGILAIGCYWQLDLRYDQTLQKFSALSLLGEVALPLMVQEWVTTRSKRAVQTGAIDVQCEPGKQVFQGLHGHLFSKDLWFPWVPTLLFRGLGL